RGRFQSRAPGKTADMRFPWSRNARLPTSVRSIGELEAEDDPHGGLQAERYRHADPRDLVEDGGTVMAGPGGAPQEGRSTEELHRWNVRWRRRHRLRHQRR